LYMTHPKLLLDKTPAFSALAEEYPDYFSLKKGARVEFLKWDEPGFAVLSVAGGYLVSYRDVSDIYRAMLEILKAGHKTVSIRREYPYEFRALMIDSSRNGVIKEEYLRKILIKLSLLGYNYACLYTEDTFEVEGEPEWGFGRGRYSKAELKKIVAFAEQFGITMFPCIQTLGHLQHILKFPKYRKLQDTDMVLNVYKADAYKLIEKAIANAVEPYKTDLIHIGMDETWGLGRGKAFEANKKIDPRRIYLSHVTAVAKICAKKKLKPVMWGDIVIGMTHEAALNNAQRRKLPKNVEMNFWNYYHYDKDYYYKTIKEYRAMGFEPMLSPGAWNWNRFWPCYGLLRETMPLFMNAGRELGVKRAMMTMWGDDGQECPWDANLPGLSLFAEYMCRAKPTEAEAKSSVELLGQSPFEDFITPSEMDYIGRESMLACSSMAKMHLYEDPIFGLFSLHNRKHRLKAKYEMAFKLASKAYSRAGARNRELLNFAKCLADVLRYKADLRNLARERYLKGNKSGLKRLAATIPGIIAKVCALWKAHRRIWLLERKTFGLETMDLRYGGIIARLKVMKMTLNAYAYGKSASIPEFEEKDVMLYGEFPKVVGLLSQNVQSLNLPHK